MLHIIRHSPYAKDISTELAALVSSDDDILLIDEGVYFNQTIHLILLTNKAKQLFIVKEHASARGIEKIQNISELELKDVADKLLQYTTTLTWQL